MTGVPGRPIPPRPGAARPPTQGGAPATPQKPAAPKAPDIYIPPHKAKNVEPTKVHPPLLALIDVLFTLMMFFIVAAKQKVMEGEVPSSLPGSNSSAEPAPIEPIRIDVDPFGDTREFATYKVNGGESIPYNETERLYGLLMRKMDMCGGKEAAKKVKVIIKARNDTKWEWVVNAFNQALRAQFVEIGFAPI